MTLQERITQLIAEHGGVRAAARYLGVDPGYVSRLNSGEKTEPSAAVLQKMGLRRVVTYEPLIEVVDIELEFDFTDLDTAISELLGE